ENFMLDKMFVHQDFNASNEVIKAALVALRVAMSPAVIKKGSTAIFLWPFNERVFTHHVLEALADVESQDSRSSTEEFAVQLAKLHEATEDGIRARDGAFVGEEDELAQVTIEVDPSTLLTPDGLAKRLRSRKK